MVPKKGEASCNSEKSSHSNAWEWFKITYLVDCPYVNPNTWMFTGAFLNLFSVDVCLCVCV